MKQDPIERFFGKIRLAGSQNDHPSMPTFMQLYQTLSIYSILKPPKYGNCKVVDGEKPLLDASHFRALISTSETVVTNPCSISQIKEKLDDLVSVDDWECEDIMDQHKPDGLQVTDCILYYITGFLCRRMRKATRCPTCLSAFSVKCNTSAKAALTNLKSRGGLTHPNAGIFNLLKQTEQFFVQCADLDTVYWDTLDSVLDTYTLTFPCAEHKEDVVAHLLHYYIGMRMRQHCKHINTDMKKQSQEKKKQAKLLSP